MTNRWVTCSLTVAAALALVANIVLCGAVLNSVRKTGRRVERIEEWLTVPILEDVKLATLGASRVKFREFVIEARDDLDELLQLFEGGADLPHPGFHVSAPGPGDVAFHPYQWSCNLLALGALSAGDERSRVAPRLEAELARAEPFVQRTANADWYPYPFEFQVGDARLRAPWQSAFGQAYVVAAFARLFRATGDPSHLERARRALQPLLEPRGQGDAAATWVSFVDEGGYLWFEEYVAPDGPAPRVLNGHIQALMGIYAYHRLAPNDATLLALRAGITTVQRYAWSFRRPGRDSRYGLGVGELRDYGPERIVNELRWLSDLTHDEFFAHARDAFATDMPVR